VVGESITEVRGEIMAGDGGRSRIINGAPEWFHGKGRKMEAMKLNAEKGTFIIANGKVAKLIIKKSPETYGDGGRKWLVAWRIVFSAGEGVRGLIYFSDDILAMAFGLSRKPGINKEALEYYGADSVIQEAFIRRGNCLNIPGPGTGGDGDPNISIRIYQKTKDAVKQLLKS
jgi:hypothetical protein